MGEEGKDELWNKTISRYKGRRTGRRRKSKSKRRINKEWRAAAKERVYVREAPAHTKRNIEARKRLHQGPSSKETVAQR